MSSINFETRILTWDTEYFQVSSARVNINGVLNEEEQEKVLSFCNDYDFVTIANVNNLAENNYWLGNSTTAYLVDTNIQFTKVLENNNLNSNSEKYIVNDLAREKQLVDIAKKTFKYSRFFNDPKLPKVKSINVYCQWVENSFNCIDKYFAISKIEEIIVGFILFSLSENNCTIELIAIDEKHQGKGVGKTLILNMESFLENMGIKQINVGTQINNINAVRFYNAMGFKYKSCNTIYHLWNK